MFNLEGSPPPIFQLGIMTSPAAAEAFDLRSLVRPNVWGLKTYRCARDDYASGILLDANENCYGSMVEVDSFKALERYPDPYQLELKVRGICLSPLPPLDPDALLLVARHEALHGLAF